MKLVEHPFRLVEVKPRSAIFGGTGRLGTALAGRLKARGDESFPVGRESQIPKSVNYAVFCQRYRGDYSVEGEFEASVAYTNRMIQTLNWAEGDKAIVIVASLFGSMVGKDQGVGYHVGKAAAIQLAKFHAAKGSIRVNVVSPYAFTGPNPKVEMGEVVDVIEFLCSPRSKGVNGQNIIVDRGESIAL